MNNYNVANTTNSNLVVFKKKIKMYNHIFIHFNFNGKLLFPPLKYNAIVMLPF